MRRETQNERVFAPITMKSSISSAACGVIFLSTAFFAAFSAAAAPVASKAATVAAPAKASGVAAVVNGEAISMEDLNRLYEGFKASEPALQTDSPAAQKALAALKPQLLEELIVIKLMAQAARKQKIVADAKIIDVSISDLRKNFKTEAELNSWLKEDGKTLADMRAMLEEEYLIREYSKSLTRDITVSGEDMAAHYRANINEFPFTIPSGVRARHILLALNPASPPEEKARVKKRAAELIKQLKNKTDFAVLARANSDDGRTRNLGGDLGTFAPGASGVPNKAFEDAVFAAKAGQIVGPIETEFGLHIIKVDSIIPAKKQEFKIFQNSAPLKAMLLKQKVQKRLDEQIVKLKAAAKITRNI